MKTTTSTFFKIFLIAAMVVMFTPSALSAWGWSSHKGSSDKGSSDKGSKGSNDKGSSDKGSACTPKGQVCGLIFEDTNDNGKFDKKTDIRLESITVNLTDINNKTYSAITNAKGKYCIYNVSYGEAMVTVDESTLPINSLQVVGDNPTPVDVQKYKKTYAGKDGYTLLNISTQLHGQVIVDGKGQNNVTLHITDTNKVIHTVTTDNKGNWTLHSLPIGIAIVNVDETTLPKNASRIQGIDNDIFKIKADTNTNAGIDGYTTTGA